MFTNETGEITWPNIVVVLEISPRIVKKHQKRAVKVANIAAEILKTIRNVLLKQVKKAAKTAVAEINPTNRRHPFVL